MTDEMEKPMDAPNGEPADVKPQEEAASEAAPAQPPLPQQDKPAAAEGGRTRLLNPRLSQQPKHSPRRRPSLSARPAGSAVGTWRPAYWRPNGR
ncbi:MAG: hypothetical protein HND48_27125 [Chloroflexi bacterium]|nr:hypothetical protein [Chloroflexota bacterium]